MRDSLGLMELTQPRKLQAGYKDRRFQILAARCGNNQELKMRACAAMRLTDNCVSRVCHACELNVAQDG